MRVIGTAGHVDHGKSTLVEALTGIHPDRLKEEREREMTIDLGFAWLTLPGGEEIGVVDVPGHRDFIENMLAGIGGIDAALFVVAADEGIMPQTREHLAILDILQIQGGVVALTKVDLVDDPEWLNLIEDDLRQTFAHTVLATAPIVRVSARTQAGASRPQGILQLLHALETCLAECPPRIDLGRPRLPVDRVFTIAGFGTVVTGTLSDGRLRVGDEVQIYPGELRGRVRGLQTHNHKEEFAVPGSRTAVNLSGIDLDQVKRGDVVARPGDFQPTQRLDVRFRQLPDVSQPLVHNTEVKLFLGAAEVVTRLRLLGSDSLGPGDEGWLQLELSEPVVAKRGDGYILRRPSPGETLGGGVVVDPHPKGRHKRFDEQVLQGLKFLSHGTPTDVLLQALQALGAAPLQEVVHRSGLDATLAETAIAEAISTRQMVALGSTLDDGGLAGRNELVASLDLWNQLSDRTLQEIESYHRFNPLRAGMPREELKSRLATGIAGHKVSARLVNSILRKFVSDKFLEEIGPLVRKSGHSIRFSPSQQIKVDSLLAKFAAIPFAPPTIKECHAEAGEDITTALVELGELAPVSPEVVFRRIDYDHMVADIRQMIEVHGVITAAEVRDHFNTSRRYVLALLEHLDASGITAREGDARRLKRDMGDRNPVIESRSRGQKPSDESGQNSPEGS